ncbi:glycoside hydrolase family 2 TIM barrel-domain containing protein [Streptococcus parasuis]|uniref:glycoside hydrolase family 2 TIM barrel-domain containing protein n=1 Tax=Streptococcus parasuis TaxID=1501662 RepID=UPI0028A0EC3B|nr:glycoside hydrolase family 2 TIM barrel-domain containing protein [Streptococcus parasuis]
MKKYDFSNGWSYKHLGTNEPFKGITVPHDAMFYEPRTETAVGGRNIGFFEGHDYIYRKEFHANTEWENSRILIEFEGVYHNAEVYLNNKKIHFRPYGYTNFFVDISKELLFDEMNVLEVVAYNSDQPNSRWYSGAGLYRPVHLYVGGKKHIKENGVRIKTLSLNPATIQLSIEASGSGQAIATIYYKDHEVSQHNLELDESGTSSQNIVIDQARLWSAENPNLYKMVVQFEDDCVTEQFGIRLLEWDSEFGLRINGKREILRGACIHHDNGLLGACAFPEAEERKIRILKKNGYNAIRSAHNPCSKAILDACDRLGVYVLDEYLDVWYIHKTMNDYANYMTDWWPQDLKDMVDKDYNHPSVIMYSTGNEVSETAQARGIELTRQMTEYLHTLDDSRPVTCGINIFFNFLSSIGLGVYSDEKAKQEVEGNKKKGAVGSEFYNQLAGIMGAGFMKRGATLYPCDLKTRDAFSNMDIAGYNYGILRYKKDLEKYPNRLILGTETFCKDAYHFWELAKTNPRIIGDFVWAGMDYMGEAGIGAWEYEDYYPKGAPESGWLTAGSGRINIVGRPNAEAFYTRVAFEQYKQPTIAVKPVYQSGSHSPSAWKMTDAISSWTYPGCEGKIATIEVYARAHRAELYVNSQLVGRKKFKNDCRLIFKTPYREGEVKVLTYDNKGQIIGQNHLVTASAITKITIEPETNPVVGKLLYILLRYTDENSIIKPMYKGRMCVNVDGGDLLGLGNACSYNRDGYLLSETDTYYGEAMAIVRVSDVDKLSIEVSDGQLKSKVELAVQTVLD